ncbi:MAG: hypothetical protein LBO20_02455, partial [Bifidobacteriaceae bacterium]|nr:hypothetical protein [Bifidobacteriaceae bacterium]
MTGNGKRGAAAAMSAFLMAGLAVGCASGEAADSGPAGGGAPERGVGAADPGWQPANQEPAGEDAVG